MQLNDLIVTAVAILAIYVFANLRSRVVLLEADLMLVHGKLMRMSKQVAQLRQDAGLESMWQEPGDFDETWDRRQRERNGG